jgi:hypothetical protein
VALKLIFLVVTRAVSVLGLSQREAWWKDAEILMLPDLRADDTDMKIRSRVGPESATKNKPAGASSGDHT